MLLRYSIFEQYSKAHQHIFFNDSGKTTNLISLRFLNCECLISSVPSAIALPVLLKDEDPLKFKSVNSLGLKRRGFSLEERKQIKKIYKIYFRSGSNRMESLKHIIDEIDSSDVKDKIVNFIKSSQRGII